MRKTLFILSLSILVGSQSMAQVRSTVKANLKTAVVGKMSVAAFNTLNAKGAALVKAIKPTKAALTNEDNALLMQVAMGGKKQLAISQAVLAKATNPQVKLLAKSEVEEQTTIAAKLKEIAAAKGIMLPATTDDAVTALVSQVTSLSGAELDAFYLMEGGIKGHQELEATMTSVNESAKDLAIRALATATLPVIRVHLKVSQDLQTSMGASASAGR